MSEGKKKKNEITVSEYSMFRPKSARRLSYDYPELGKEDVFKKLDSNELLFCWYYSHECSPLFDLEISPAERCAEAIKMSFEKDRPMNPKLKAKYLKLDFQESMRMANAKMSTYRPTIRLRSLMMTDKVYSNFESILNIDASDDENFKNKDGEVDIAKKKQYVETAKTAIAMLPNLIEMIESQFSVEVDFEDKKDGELSFLDDFHDQKK